MQMRLDGWEYDWHSLAFDSNSRLGNSLTDLGRRLLKIFVAVIVSANQLAPWTVLYEHLSAARVSESVY